MRYLAVLDHDHLDDGVFLNSFAHSLSQQQNNKQIQPIILHTDSAYTDRIIQTGVMRNEATIRSMKDLNKRLVALFADEGVSTIGLNPYKKNLITLANGNLKMDHTILEGLPRRPVLLLSSLVQNLDTNEVEPIDLPQMIDFLQQELDHDELFIFMKSDESEVFTPDDIDEALSWKHMPEDFREEQIPDELDHLNRRIRITNARDFNQLPTLDHTILVK